MTASPDVDIGPVFHYATDDRIGEKTGIHVWLLDLDRPISKNTLQDALSAGEWSHSEALKDETERARYLARCLYLRNTLSSLTGLNPAALEFEKDACGKPRLKRFSDSADDSMNGLSFSISHAEEGMAVAVAFGREVGVDVEKMNQEIDFIQVAEASLAREDLEKLRLLPAEDRTRAFYNLWTEREAVGKMEGRGMLQHNHPETRTHKLDRVHWFEWSNNIETLLGAVALGEPQ